ncbi:MAG: hypothetical protein C0490_24890 [Marivirga sp.]|nr:hypothetical protein [Marivirga sp.]
MKQEHKILVIGIIAVGLLDTFGSMASRQLDFNYSHLSFVSFIIYGTTSFLATRIKNLMTGVVYGMILGFFDSTIGLKISLLLDANTGGFNDEITTAVWIFIVVFMIGFGALSGLIGGVLTRIGKKRGTNAQQRFE